MSRSSLTVLLLLCSRPVHSLSFVDERSSLHASIESRFVPKPRIVVNSRHAKQQPTSKRAPVSLIEMVAPSLPPLTRWLATYRLVAFTSEVGESLRPVVSRWAVGLAYGVSWLYVIIDVITRTLVELKRGNRVCRALRVMLFFSIFHSVVTMLIPAVLIHSAVNHTQHLLHAASLVPNLVSLWGPTAFGISLIPLLPLFDPPMEKVLHNGFERVWPQAASDTDEAKRHHGCYE